MTDFFNYSLDDMIEYQGEDNDNSTEAPTKRKKAKRSGEYNDESSQKRQQQDADTSRWAIMYRALIEYGKDKPNCNAPINCECVQDGNVLMLGTWLSTISI